MYIADSLLDKYYCHSCNSATDPDCISNPHRGIERDLCMSFDYRCYTKVTNGILERGCAPFFEDVCDNERNCEVCDGGNWCNNRTFHDTCIQCSGEYGCRHQPDPSLFTTICSLKSVENSEGCYLAKSGKTYTRGCMEDLSDVDRIQCQGQSDECQRCTSPNCNQKIDFNIDCYECNGKGNTRCARSENLTQISCDGYSKTCVTGIDGNGITHRGCVPYDGYSTRSPQFPDGFQRCFSNLCNGEVFPENRTKCYQCEGVDCTYVKYQDAILKPCYSQRDECYSYVSKGIYSTD